jgi:hypothetical protein
MRFLVLMQTSDRISRRCPSGSPAGIPLFLGQRTIDDDSRHWPRAEKERIVAAAVEPGTVASEVARQSFLDRVKRPNTRASLFLGAPGDIAGAGIRFPDSVSDGCVDDLGIN